MANSKMPTGAMLRKLVSVMFPNANRVDFEIPGEAGVYYPKTKYHIVLRSHPVKEGYYSLCVFWYYLPNYPFSFEHREDFLNGTPLRKSMSHILRLLDQRKAESLERMTAAVTTER